MCKARKDELYENLDKQLINFKTNYGYYKTKLERYFNPSSADDLILTKDKIIEKINNCSETEDLDLLIKNIKDEMEENQTMATVDNWQEYVMSGFKDAAATIRDQAKQLPVSKFNNF
mmetsp:Transcript_32320/g.29148  ORF Transcript_32320/g.29148 Transcript_32320/m.29148 type:complete len:117 (+) Transcript_32320:415-765(+)